MYTQGNYKDHLFIRCIVYWMYIFEALQTVLLTHDTFHQLAYSFGNFDGLVAAYLTGFELVIQSALSTRPPSSSPLTRISRVLSRLSRDRDAVLLRLAHIRPRPIQAHHWTHCLREEYGPPSATHCPLTRAHRYRCSSVAAGSRKASRALCTTARRQIYRSRHGPLR